MKLNTNLLDVTIHFTDNEHYYSYTVSEIYDPKKADFFKQFFNYDPIVCDVTCHNDLVSGVIHDYLNSDYIFDIIENLNNLADGETEDQFTEKLRLVHVFHECVGSDIMTACNCIENHSFIELSDCVTEQDLGIALAYRRGIFDELKNSHSDIDYEHYFDFDAYGRDCRITEDWEYYNGSYWHFDY